MAFAIRRSTIFQALWVLLYFLRSVCATSIPSPFIFYNDTLPIGTSGYVSWDLHAFSGPVNLWIQQNYPNASVARVSISFSNTAGYMLWEVGINVPPGEYYFELQITSGTGIIYKSDIWSVICATCPLPSSTTSISASSSGSTSHSSYSTTYTSSMTSVPGLTTMVMPTTTTSSSTSSPTVAAAPTHSEISSGAAAGIGVGAAGAVSIIAVLIWLFSRSRRRRRERQLSTAQTQPWVPPPQHIGDSPEMKTYSSSSPFNAPAHSRQWSHELQSSEFVHGPPQVVSGGGGVPIYRAQSPTSSPQMSNTGGSHMSSPPHSPHLAQNQVAPPGHYHQPSPPPVQPNQPWTHTGVEGNQFSPYEGLNRSDNDGSANMRQGHGSPESQQGLSPPRRPVGS